MNLPFVGKFFSKGKDKEFIIALEIKQGSVIAHLLEKNLSALNLLTSHENKLSQNISDTSVEDLIEASDNAISQIEGSAPPGTFIKKTLFTVPYEWQKEGKINVEKLSLLKNLCDELELTPIGFLVPIEAIIHELRRREGTLSNAIFLELETKVLTAYVARAGSIVEIVRQPHAESIGHSAELLFSGIKSLQVLPNRIMVLRGSQADNLQQELVSKKWPDELPFLHPPQVTVMEKGFESQAIVNGVAEKMNLSAPEFQKEGKSSKIQAKGEDFGFYKETDVAKETPVKESSAQQPENIASKNLTPITQPVDEKKEESEDKKDNQFLSFTLPPSVSNFLRKAKTPFKATSGIPIGFKLLPLLILFFLAALIYIYYSFILKADVIVYADEKKTEEEVPVVLSEKGTTAKDTIHISIDKIEIKGEESKKATGKETTGEKATGEVTVFNKTENKVSFSQGDVISSDTGASFILTDDIEIASTSAFSTSFSSKKVEVEAEDFGDEYNLKSGTNFTFDDYPSSDFFAKNSDNFSGGTSEEITVVSEDDIEKLSDSLLKNLQKKALKQAKDNISSKETLIPHVISQDLTDQSFSKEAGNEAKNVTLSATGVFEIGYYLDDEIDNFIKGVSTEDVPQGYVFNKEESKIEFEDVEVDDGELTAQANITAVHLPAIKKEELKKSLARITATEAKKTIRENNAVKKVDIIYSRKFPFVPEMLPWNAKNINVILKTQ